MARCFHHTDDSVAGWSEKPWRAPANAYRLPANRKLHARIDAKGKKLRGPAFESAEADDEQYADGMTAAKAIADLQRLSKQDQPFFLAVGLMKPHLPFVAPKKYWDLYDPSTIKLPENYKVPKDAPAKAIHKSGELRTYYQIPPTGPVSDEMARSLIHGYYACVSFADAQVGRVLSELERLELDENTIVVLWGDHGWNLGDHTLWCKHSCFESSMHAPLIVRAPGIEGGTKTSALTEFIDIYPTLCELAGLEKPSHLEGRSFTPLLHDPNVSWKIAAIGRYQSGDTIRTDRYRFTEYSTKAGKPYATMLYDHDNDLLENSNIAESQELSTLNESLKKTLKKTMKKTLQQQMEQDK